MGVLLSKPNIEKEFEDGGNEKLEYACCSMQVPYVSEQLLNGQWMLLPNLSRTINLQGWRSTMEDAHTAELNIDGKNTAFFGVFDGLCCFF